MGHGVGTDSHLEAPSKSMPRIQSTQVHEAHGVNARPINDIKSPILFGVNSSHA